jgi:hypothetical protein
MTRDLPRIARLGSLSLLGITIALVALSGCSKPKGKLHGKVYYKDKPLSSGTVTLMADSKTVGTGSIQADGSYAISNVPVGEVTILVTTGAGPIDKSSPPPTLPKQYGDPAKSPEKVTITTEDQERDIRIKG